MNTSIRLLTCLLFVPILAGMLFTSCKEGKTDRQTTLQDMDEKSLELNLRSRKKTDANENVWQLVEQKESWDPGQTAIIITDMWDKHWCESATERVDELAPAMNEVIAKARSLGITIIHAPSGTIEAYENTPQRQRAVQSKYHPAPAGFDLQQWCYLDPDKEAQLPIDDSDGGCDKPCPDGEPCIEKSAWSRQIDAIHIDDEDFISDDGQEVYNILIDRGIENLIIMGVHINMCVLGRSFAIRQMSNLGKNVVLMRDMTDSMYNPEMPPFVSHFEGTDLVIEHIEKYWVSTILSSDLTGKDAFRFQDDNRPI